MLILFIEQLKNNLLGYIKSQSHPNDVLNHDLLEIHQFQSQYYGKIDAIFEIFGKKKFKSTPRMRL